MHFLLSCFIVGYWLAQSFYDSPPVASFVSMATFSNNQTLHCMMHEYKKEMKCYHIFLETNKARIHPRLGFLNFLRVNMILILSNREDYYRYLCLNDIIFVLIPNEASLTGAWDRKISAKGRRDACHKHIIDFNILCYYLLSRFWY